MDLCISSNVIEKIQDLYNLSKENVLDIISRPPKTSVLRVNTKATSIDDAIQLLYNNYKTDEYDIAKHVLLDDVITITPKHFERNPVTHDKEVMIDASCGTAVLRGADIFAPGVLAAHSSIQVGDIVSVYCDVMNKCRKGFSKTFVGKKFFVGNGVAKMSRSQLFELTGKLTSGIAIEMNESKYNLPSFNNLEAHIFYPQNLPSVVVGHVLNAQEGDFVLDMCAAPGGKSSHVAILLDTKGCVISIDKTKNKVEKIRENFNKLDLNNARCFCYDSTKLMDETKEGEEIIEPPFPPNSFDRILLDPPCSGLGQRPQLRYILIDKELTYSYAVLQKKFFKQAVGLLKPGGTLVFSTCTLLPEENETQVAWVIKTFPEMYLVDQFPKLGRIGLEGYGLNLEEREKVQRFDHCFYSNHTEDTIGFFIAKFMKHSSS